MKREAITREDTELDLLEREWMDKTDVGVGWAIVLTLSLTAGAVWALFAVMATLLG